MAIMYKTSKGASGCTTCYLWNSHPYRHYLWRCESCWRTLLEQQWHGRVSAFVPWNISMLLCV
jgi:hypothetical protein